MVIIDKRKNGYFFSTGSFNICNISIIRILSYKIKIKEPFTKNLHIFACNLLKDEEQKKDKRKS